MAGMNLNFKFDFTNLKCDVTAVTYTTAGGLDKAINYVCNLYEIYMVLLCFILSWPILQSMVIFCQCILVIIY